MAVSMIPIAAASGGADAIAKVVTELIRKGEVPPTAPTSALPVVAGTTEGTKQLRAILRAQTKQAKINAKAQMVSTLLASPVAMLVVAFGSFVAANAVLNAISNHHPDETTRLYARALMLKIPAADNISLPNFSGALPTLPSMPSMPAMPGNPFGGGIGGNPLSSLSPVLSLLGTSAIR